MGTQELIVVAVIILILFGPKKIPEIARGIGSAIGEVQKGIRDSQRMMNESIRESASDDRPAERLE